MTKLKSPSINLMLRKSKVNSKGEHPLVLIVAMNGRVEKSTGIWLLDKHWDAQRQQVRKSCPNYLNVQHSLTLLVRECEDRKMELERSGVSYSLRDIIEGKKIVQSFNGRYKELMYNYIASKGITNGTAKTYIQSYNRLSVALGSDFLVRDISQGFIRSWMRSMMDEGLKGSNVLKLLKACHTICLYGVKKGVIHEDPFEGIKLGTLEKTHRLYHLSSVHVRLIREYLMDMLKADGGVDRLHRRWGNEFAVGLFYILLKMNGCAPIDAALLKVRDVNRKVIGGSEYYSVSFRRRKTGVAVDVLWKVDELSDLLLGGFLSGKSADDYVYPILVGNEKDVVKACGAVCSRLIVRLRKWLDKEINVVIERLNGLSEEKIDIIDTGQVVYYTARHTLATHYLNSSGANAAELAAIMGRSVSGIGTYVHQLTDEQSTLLRLERLSF